jgi:hypothetical protein
MILEDKKRAYNKMINGITRQKEQKKKDTRKDVHKKKKKKKSIV